MQYIFLNYFYSMENYVNSEIADILEKICKKRPCCNFGEPFTTAFRILYRGEEEEISAAAYICSLYLSAVKVKFPTEKLHIFVHRVQEEFKRFYFDCKMYDKIIGMIDKERLKEVSLYDSNCNIIKAECSYNDIKEALDFYTNR